MSIRCPLTLLMGWVVVFPGQGIALDLIRDGKPSVTIVTADEPTPSAKLAALEIAHHLRAATGRDVPILPHHQQQGKPAIYVGPTPTTQALGYRASDFAPQEYAVVVKEDAVILIGRDWEPSQALTETEGIPMSGGESLPETRHPISYMKAVGGTSPNEAKLELPGIYDDQGTLLAAYDFLERYLGARWYAPGPQGTVLPPRSNLSIPEGVVRRSPALKLRCALASGNWPFMQRQWGNVSAEQVHLHWRRLRLGGERWSGNHTFHRQTIPLAFTDPEYQCRNVLGKGSQLCYTNRKLIEQVAQMARDYFDGKGNLPAGWKALGDYFAIVPDDTSHFCTCPDCKPLLRQGDNYRTKCFNTGKASPYWYHFVNEVAREVGKTHPDKYIATLAYWQYAVPPDFPLEPNVSIAPCMITCSFPIQPVSRENDMKIYRQWLTKTSAPMFMWIYYHHPMEPALIQGWKCFPHMMLHPTVEYSRTFIRNGLRGIFVCGEQDQLEHYVMTRIWDNPDADVEAMTDEFFSLYFGPASEPMKRFYTRLEQIACDPANYPKEAFRNDNVDWRMVAWKHLGTPDRVEELGRLMDQASSSPLDSPYRERVSQWRHAFWDWIQEGRQQFEREGR